MSVVAFPQVLPGLESLSSRRLEQLVGMIPWQRFDPIIAALQQQRLQRRQAARHLRRQRQQQAHAPLLPPQPQAPSAATTPVEARTGRRPWSEVAILRAFVLVRCLGVIDAVSACHLHLNENPALRVACGLPGVPSYRSLCRFDADMTRLGLWESFRLICIDINRQAGLIRANSVAIVDTVHVEAEATLGKTTTGPDGQLVPTDDNVGLLHKSPTRSFIAHKISMLRLRGVLAPLTATVEPGNRNDGKTLLPPVRKFKAEQPDLLPALRYLEADGPFNTAENRQGLAEELPGVILLSPVNPRNAKPKPLDRPGMDHISPSGIPVCSAGHHLRLLGRDRQRQQYIWHCPLFGGRQDPPPGVSCAPEQHQACCAGSPRGRTVHTPRELSPLINWELPQPSARHVRLYRERLQIEGSFGILVEMFGFRQVHKRGRLNVQAHVDRCLGCMHLWWLVHSSLKQQGLRLAA